MRTITSAAWLAKRERHEMLLLAPTKGRWRQCLKQRGRPFLFVIVIWGDSSLNWAMFRVIGMKIWGVNSLYNPQNPL